MAYCRNCGAEINEYALTCPKCGAQQRTEPSASPDEGGFLWGLLGCCIPIVGLVLWLVWKDQKPRTAKAAGIGALVAVGLGALYYVLIFMLGIGIVLGS